MDFALTRQHLYLHISITSYSPSVYV